MAKAKSSSTKDKTKRPAAAATTSEVIEAEEPKITRVSVGASRRSGVASELVLGALVAELVGTFILTFALLNTGGNVIIGGVVVMVLVMALSRLSGGHVNPAVTLAMAATRQISVIKAAGYIVAQVLGAMLALVIMTQFVHATPADATTGQAASVYTVANVTGQWRPFFAEVIGGLVFGLGAAGAVLGRKNSHESGFIIGGALLVGLIIASVGSSAILNPAVAVGLSAYHFENWWSVMAYGIAPLIGVTAGAWLYKLLQWDVTGKKTAEE
jgi:glycerol uptake facilitator-like aquaporin